MNKFTSNVLSVKISRNKIFIFFFIHPNLKHGNFYLKLGARRIHTVRTRGGNKKYRALRLDQGNFSWASEGKLFFVLFF